MQLWVYHLIEMSVNVTAHNTNEIAQTVVAVPVSKRDIVFVVDNIR